MKRLSIIIVNYNVKHFIEQCLLSVRAAIKGIDAEVFVVDNNSVDGSQAMLRERFPDITLIESKENIGFSAGNNLAMRIATGHFTRLRFARLWLHRACTDTWTHPWGAPAPTNPSCPRIGGLEKLRLDRPGCHVNAT